MLSAVGSGVTSIIGWLGDVLEALTDTTASAPGALSVLLPMVGVAIGFFVIRYAISIIKSIVVGF